MCVSPLILDRNPNPVTMVINGFFTWAVKNSDSHTLTRFENF